MSLNSTLRIDYKDEGENKLREIPTPSCPLLHVSQRPNFNGLTVSITDHKPTRSTVCVRDRERGYISKTPDRPRKLKGPPESHSPMSDPETVSGTRRVRVVDNFRVKWKSMCQNDSHLVKIYWYPR